MRSESNPRLEFRAVSKSFGKELALDRLTLALEPGEILGFLGPNGAGKTTAIHLALGFLRPTSGAGFLLGRPFGNPEARRRLGFLADTPSFFAESAASSVELTARLNGVRDRHLQRAVQNMLAEVGLERGGEDRKDARKFSRGMQQRLALAQAFINDPELLILDEPTSALDPAGVQQTRELLRGAREAGKSIFFSSHQLTEVEQISDRIAFLNHGRLIRYGPLDEFLAHSSTMEAQIRGISAEAAQALFPGLVTSGAAGGPLRIRFAPAEQRRILETLWNAGGEVINLAPIRGRLEDLFLAWSRQGIKGGDQTEATAGRLE